MAREYNGVIFFATNFFFFSLTNFKTRYHSPMNSKKRSQDQTATAISLSRELFEALEAARAELAMDRSNFIRMCLKKELQRMNHERNGKKA